MKKTFSALLLLAILLGNGAIAATLPPELVDAASQGRLLSLQSWNPDNTTEGSLTAAIVQPAKPEQIRSALVVYQATRRIFSFSSEQSPLWMFTTSELGNLATVWEAGDGTYILCVFAYQDGKVKKVLEGSSKLMPEFVYAPTPQGSLLVDSKRQVPGGYWSRRIIIANMDWVHDAKTGASEYLPLTADIFTWDGKRYVVRENVKWTDRLK
jgi:hypothetical protein